MADLRIFGVIAAGAAALGLLAAPVPASRIAARAAPISASISGPIAGQQPVITAKQAPALAALSEGTGADLMAEGDDARARNAAIATSAAGFERMKGFASAPSAAAEQCLAQAIYYEAGYEPEQGRRAVAQVVLNRVAHPAWPGSVCGVVYQGVNDPVCQFSFTCDGALSRAPRGAAWADAKRIAADALAGRVEKSVGSATHYHADYVVPRWAYRLGKLRKIGTHIFYRFNGRAGTARAFTQLYAGREHIPEITAQVVQLADGRDPMTGQYENGLTVAPAKNDRHAPADIGGRLDTSKGWRLTLPAAGESRYRQLVASKVDAVPVADASEEAEPGA